MTDYLLAQCVDALRGANWQRSGKGKPPEPIPRPRPPTPEVDRDKFESIKARHDKRHKEGRCQEEPI